MLRFILDRAANQLRTDAAVFVAMWLAFACWPFDLIFDLIGIAP